MKIAYIYNSNSYFTRLDLEILSRNHKVYPLFFKSKSEVLNLWNYLPILIRSDIFVCWFASWHTLIPLIISKLLKKPFLLIAGGYDSANVPEAGYGNQRIWWRRILSNFCFRNTTKLIVNSHFIEKEILSIGGINRDRLQVIYHGIPVLTEVMPFDSKKLIALNVGNLSRENVLRKGIKPFLLAAKHLPEWTFIHAGSWIDNSHKHINSKSLTNVHLEGYVSDERLKNLFRSASVYIQPSLHEGFGMSVIEAMQFGCIPIVSKYGALPEVVGEFGLVLENLDPITIAEAVKKATLIFSNRRIEIQNYIHVNFNLQNREDALINVIASIVI
jgi:glycosyltransferase involved in cell wall biosynthesis